MTNLEIALEYMERIAAGDHEGALSMIADDAVMQGPLGEKFDKDGLRALLAMVGPLFAGPMDQAIVGTTAEGKRVAIEATASAPLTNGKTYSNHYHFLFEVADGKIARVHEYNNPGAAAVFGPALG